MRINSSGNVEIKKSLILSDLKEIKGLTLKRFGTYEINNGAQDLWETLNDGVKNLDESNAFCALGRMEVTKIATDSDGANCSVEIKDNVWKVHYYTLDHTTVRCDLNCLIWK